MEELPKVENKPILIHSYDAKPNTLSVKVILLLVASSIFLLLVVGTSVYMIAASNGLVGKVTQPTIVALPTPTIVFENPNESIVIPSVSQDATPTPSPTNKYANTKYHFSFSYPTSWNLTTQSSQDPKVLLYIVISPKSSPDQLSITLTYSTRSYNEVLALINQPAEKIVVGNIESGRRVVKDSDGNISVQVILPFQGHTFVFLAREQYKEILDALLATFQFKT